MVDDTIDDTVDDTADDSVNDRFDDRVNAPNACRLRPIVLSVKPTDERAIGDNTTTRWQYTLVGTSGSDTPCRHYTLNTYLI